MADRYGNDKQGFVAGGRVVPSEDSSTNQVKSQFYDLEVPRPHSAIPAGQQNRPDRRLIFWGIKYGLTVLVIGAALAAPVIVFRNDRFLDPDDDPDAIASKQTRNLLFNLFAWLLITWLGSCVTDIFILAFPFIFRAVACYVNPAHQRYYKIFRALRMPVTLVGFIISTYISFDLLINTNGGLAVNFNKPIDAIWWDDIIDDVLLQLVFWIVGYMLEKLLILYISVHYRYRSDQGRIAHNKQMHGALVTLYEASIYLHPVHSRHFAVEDSIIQQSSGTAKDSASSKDAGQFLRKVGVAGDKIANFFGNFKSDSQSHWLQPSAPYAIVERSLSHPKSAAALAKRIWMSLVVQGRDAFSAEDIAEVLGPYRREEALEIFKVIDENESGDIRLDEMVWTVVEAGRIRHAIYQGMADINHCINTFDWIALLLLAMVMTFYIMNEYIPSLKGIQSTTSFILLGLSFAAGRTVNKFLTGCILVFFEHPFDIGDRVNIYNMAATNAVSCIVVRQSLLFTIFRRIDNGTDLQINHERLAVKRIENISRSGLNKQQIAICVDFKTRFKDIMFLRSQLESFLAENRRDYEPTLNLSVTNIHELNKLELSVSFTHKSNWSNERLRASRSSKFMCALVAAIRLIPLMKPGGSGGSVGDEGKPMYTVSITDAEAAEKVKADKKKKADARWDAIQEDKTEEDEEKRKKAEEKAAKEKAEQEAEEKALMEMTKVPTVPTTVQHDVDEAQSMGVASLIKHVSTGLRSKSGSHGPAGMFHPQ